MSLARTLGLAPTARRGARRVAPVAPVVVVPLPDPTAVRCSWMLVCGRTRAAAIVDPEPAQAERVTEVLAERDLSLKLVLRTRPTVDQAAPHQRYSDLLGELGLGATPRRSGPSHLPWQGLECIAPVGFEARADGRGRSLRVRHGLPGGETRTVLLDLVHSDAPRTTLRGSQDLDDGAHASELRVALGAFHVAALPHREQPRLAWQVADRLFSGAALYAAAALPASADDETPRTPSAALALPDEVLVYPATATGGLLVSTVAQERSARGGSTRRGVRHLRLHQAR